MIQAALVRGIFLSSLSLVPQALVHHSFVFTCIICIAGAVGWINHSSGRRSWLHWLRRRLRYGARQINPSLRAS
ncbi:hypothetical protein BKA80DRAFT_270223 [Phyllosticta citrichinensis]